MYPELYSKIVLWKESIKDIVLNKNVKFITEALKKKMIPSLRRGDVIHIKWGSSYRNVDSYFWNGEQVILFNHHKTIYVYVPLQFKFPEFSPDYFIYSIDSSHNSSINHNTIINFTPEKLQEIKNNFNPETQLSYVTDRYNKYIINIDADYDIKFREIFVDSKSYFEYDARDNSIILYLSFSRSGYNTNFTNVIIMDNKWKNSVTEVSGEYKWVGNKLVIKKNFLMM